MLGYVQGYKPEMKVREYEIYSGYYCGICKYIGHAYGQFPRFVLSYDAAFLAILLASVSDETDDLKREQCIVHHIQKRTVIRNKAVAFSGDVMLILAWYNLLDDAEDDGSAGAKAVTVLYKRLHKKLSRKYPELCTEIEKHLDELHDLEKSRCNSIDRVAEPFSMIMKELFSQGIRFLYGQDAEMPNAKDFDNLHESFANIGYHMGKWIYLMDAADDLEDDIKSGSYNPLIYRFGYEPSEPAADFRRRIKDSLGFNLYHYLSVIGDLLGNLEIKKNKGIIDNILYFGLNRKTEWILNKGVTDEPI